MPFATPLTPLLAAAFEIPLFFLPADLNCGRAART
jgi:hypothetical protein